MKANVHELSNEDLGRELGQAISNAVDDDLDPGFARPTVGSIVERAEAKAKVRQTRRVVGSVAASMALFAGVAVGWNALNSETEAGVVAAAPTVVNEAQAADSGAVSPADFSTGPAPRWAQVQAPPVLGLTMQATGDGRVVGLGWDDDSQQQQLFVTADGREWTPVATPELYDATVSVSADAWVLIGNPTEGDFESRLVHVSTDGGTSWEQREFDPEPRRVATLPYTQNSRTVTGAIASGGAVVLTVQGFVSVDIEALLIDRGLLDPDETALVAGSAGEDTLSVEVIPRSSELVGPTVESVASRSYSYEELGLSTEAAAILTQGGREFAEIYASTGGQFELVRSADASVAGLASTDSGFLVTMFDDSSTTLLTSQDGRTWSEVAEQQAFEGALVAYGDQVWSVSWEPDGSSTLWRLTPSGDWNQIARLDGLSADGPLSVGPGGMALSAMPLSQNSDDQSIDAGKTWVGWSATGSDWGWQDSAEVFNTRGDSDVSLVVGDGFVLARVEDFDPDGDNPLVEPSTQWFRADIG